MKTFCVIEHNKNHILSEIQSIAPDGKTEIIIRPVSRNKTLRQLNTLFGVWLKHVSEYTGDELDSIHKMLKAKFLARIYGMDPANDLQEQWVELMLVYADDAPRLKRHVNRLSLSWATLGQMKHYMDLVSNYYIANGIPLPLHET